LRSAEIRRRADVLAAAPSDDPFVQRLVQSADQFIVRRGDESTVIAGYHWFSDWGRDTMIALPGLALATGRFDAARRILLAFAASVDRGMLPNRFPDSGETPEYNTVDATLGNAFDERQVSALPLEGRNVVELLSLQPGVTFLGKNAGNGDDDSRSGSVNGVICPSISGPPRTGSTLRLWLCQRP